MRIVCPRCSSRVRPQRPSRLWWVALGALAIFFTACVAASSLIGPFIMFAVPLLAMLGFAFGPIWERCRAQPSCPVCSRILAGARTECEARRARATAKLSAAH